jgi:hypothetical protein
MFVLRQLSSLAQRSQNTQLHLAFIDLTKAYDWVNRAALWRILRTYRVPSKIVELLEDLHTGTLAAVRLGGDRGGEFTVSSGVRQGCIVAPLLFNVFLDFVVKQALESMPPDAGVGVQFRADGRTLFDKGRGQSLTLQRIALLLYADDMVLFSTVPENLVLMLQRVDEAAERFAMRINATKTKVMSVGKGTSMLPENITISGGAVERVDRFKYLGGVVASNASAAAEINARRGRGLGAFASFSQVWENKHLTLGAKVRVFNTFILPHFVYGCESWNSTQTQQHRLETAYNSCLRGIMGIRVSDQHSLQHIWSTCKVEPLACLLARRRLSWLGHVARLKEDRYPRIALFAQCLTGATFGPGKPPQTFNATVLRDLKAADIPIQGGDWYGQVQDKPLWQGLVRGLTGEKMAQEAPTRQQPARACKH